MGITGSKVAQEDKEEVTPVSVPTTPILTPKNKKSVEEIIDPRSPSCSILRTPITTCASPFTPEANTCDTFNINSPALVTNLDDPRSPTLAFTRTPITAVEDSDLLKRVQMRNLQNIKKVISDMPSQIPPKLLESSPINRKSNENHRKSYVGLLETNMDFVETDLDAVILSKSSPSSIKYTSPSKTDLKAKFFELNQEDPTEEKEDIVEEIKQDDEIILTPVEDNIENQEIYDDALQTIEQEVFEVVNIPAQNVHIDDDGLILQPRAKTPVRDSTNIQVTPKKLQPELTTIVQEFEKKVNHLIYTEENITTPPVNKFVAIQGKTGSNRTPLGTKNGNNGNTQIVAKNKPKLRVSDKPRRADYAVSRIPVFNCKNKAECENTPPRSMAGLDGRKNKRAQWDSDNTLII